MQKSASKPDRPLISVFALPPLSGIVIKFSTIARYIDQRLSFSHFPFPLSPAIAIHILRSPFAFRAVTTGILPEMIKIYGNKSELTSRTESSCLTRARERKTEKGIVNSRLERSDDENNREGKLDWRNYHRSASARYTIRNENN
jgi:hypothetical protein